MVSKIINELEIWPSVPDQPSELYRQIETTFSDKLYFETELSRDAMSEMSHLLDKLLHTLVKSLHQIMFIKLTLLLRVEFASLSVPLGSFLVYP